jgi:hypothetical protein
MSSLYASIRSAIAAGSTVVSVHATLRLRQRRIPLWQVETASQDGELLGQYPNAEPNPKIELDILLPDGTSAKAVWSWLKEDAAAKLVTVHFFDE